MQELKCNDLDCELGKFQLEVSSLKEQIAMQDELIKIALTALGYYANRMDTGGTARDAIKKIKSEVESE
jgi:hypothetical protein